MGWTVYYKAFSTQPISEEERRILDEHRIKWNKKLHEGCASYGYNISDDGQKIHGITKVSASVKDEEDYITILSALQEIDKKLPGFKFKITDDYFLADFGEVAPSFVGNPHTFPERLHRQLLEDFDGFFEKFETGQIQKMPE